MKSKHQQEKAQEQKKREAKIKKTTEKWSSDTQKSP